MKFIDEIQAQGFNINYLDIRCDFGINNYYTGIAHPTPQNLLDTVRIIFIYA